MPDQEENPFQFALLHVSPHEFWHAATHSKDPARKHGASREFTPFRLSNVLSFECLKYSLRVSGPRHPKHKPIGAIELVPSAGLKPDAKEHET